MSRTSKDRPYRLGGDRHRYWCAPTGHAKFTRQCRQVARAKAKRDLYRKADAEPKYPVEHLYFD